MYYNSLILPDGRQLPDDGAAILSVQLRRRASEEKQMLPGGVCAAQLEAEILDTNGQLHLTAGDKVQLLRIDEEGKARKIGEFLLEKPERIGTQTLRLIGYDAVKKLDADMTQWLAGLDRWPYRLADFARIVSAHCGLTLVTENIPNADLEVKQFAAIVTGRQLMRWICQACCRFCRATADGELELAWVTKSNVMLQPTGERFYYRGGLRYADYKTAPIDGVQLRLADGKSSYFWPDNGAENPWIITANPILAETSHRTEQALTVIAGQLEGLQYTPCTVTIPANEELTAGQMVAVQTPNGGSVQMCIVESRRDGARDTLSGEGSMLLDAVPSAEDRAALEALNAAASAVAGLTQGEIFDKLTNGGKAQGVYLLDGQIYINASYLAAGVIRSADGTVEIDLGANTVTIHTEDGKLVLAAGGLYGYGADGVQTLVLKPGSGTGMPTLLNSFQSAAGLTVAAGKSGAVLTLGQPGAGTVIRGSSLMLLGKTVQWTANGDGTYALVGT